MVVNVLNRFEVILIRENGFYVLASSTSNSIIIFISSNPKLIIRFNKKVKKP